MTNMIPYADYIKIGVNSGQIPQFLYKYRNINDTVKLLGNNSLYFANPGQFNDPFDCQIVPNTDNTEEEILQWFKSTVPELSEEKISELAFETFNTPEKWKNTIEGAFQRTSNKNGICCFTENANNLLMWSHYADMHRGVCLKFNVLADPYFFTIPLPVKYAKEYPFYNHLTNIEDIVRVMALTKSEHWEYEEEFRILKPNGSGLNQFQKHALTEIIFGCNADEKKISKLMRITKSKGYNVSFKKAIKKRNEFGLEIVDLTI